MIEISTNKFRANMKAFVDQALSAHSTIRIKRRSGKDFVVLAAEDWEREQETLYILQNSSLMRQITESMGTYTTDTGYNPSEAELNAINRI